MSKKRMNDQVPFDYDKIQRVFRMRGLTMTEACVAMGISRSYFYNANAKNGISRAILQLMELKYGIKYEDIKKDEPKGESDKPTTDPQQLHDVINCASYQALRSIVRDKETQGILEEILYRAFTRALKEG